MHTDPESKCKPNKTGSCGFKKMRWLVRKLNLAGGYLFIPVTTQTDNMYRGEIKISFKIQMTGKGLLSWFPLTGQKSKLDRCENKGNP